MVKRLGISARIKEQERRARLERAGPKLLELVQLFEECVRYQIEKTRKSGDDEGVRLQTVTLNLILEGIREATEEPKESAS